MVSNVGDDIIVVEVEFKFVLQMCDVVLIWLDDGAQVLRSFSSHVFSACGSTLSCDTNATTKATLYW